MSLIRLETGDDRFVGNVEVMPFLEAPHIVIWGSRYFILKDASPPAEYKVGATYKEAFVAMSFTSNERCLELSQ